MRTFLLFISLTASVFSAPEDGTPTSSHQRRPHHFGWHDVYGAKPRPYEANPKIPSTRDKVDMPFPQLSNPTIPPFVLNELLPPPMIPFSHVNDRSISEKELLLSHIISGYGAFKGSHFLEAQNHFLTALNLLYDATEGEADIDLTGSFRRVVSIGHGAFQVIDCYNEKLSRTENIRLVATLAADSARRAEGNEQKEIYQPLYKVALSLEFWSMGIDQLKRRLSSNDFKDIEAQIATIATRAITIYATNDIRYLCCVVDCINLFKQEAKRLGASYPKIAAIFAAEAEKIESKLKPKRSLDER